MTPEQSSWGWEGPEDVYLAQRDKALGGGEVLEGDAHARVLRGEAQEAPDAKHEGDVEAGDAKRRQRLPYDAPLHPLQQRDHPARVQGAFKTGHLRKHYISVSI